MTEEPEGGALGRRVAAIGLTALAMLLLVVVVVPAVTGGGAPVLLHPEPVPAFTDPPIAAERGPFLRTGRDFAVDPSLEGRAGARSRTLATFRERRAYPGAPPRIPHEVADVEFLAVACNQCHLRGGWAERFGAYTPPTPHPEMTSCAQCHVPANTSGLFRPTDWQPAPWPQVGARAMEGSPLVIPHGLEMRGSCLSCHGGPSAVAEIRTTHPERINCRQCHVQAERADSLAPAFERPIRAEDAGDGLGREAGR